MKCHITAETERYHQRLAKTNREAERIERDTRESIKHNVSEVLDEIDREEFARKVLIAVRNNPGDLLALGTAVKEIADAADNEAVAAIVDRELGLIGL